MNLFDQVLNAVNNPNQQASSNQLGSILNTVQQLSGNQGVNPSTTQALLSIVGGHVRSALQQKQQAGGSGQVESIVNQYSGTGANPTAVQSLFTTAQQQQVAQDASQKTGVNLNTVLTMLPILVPLVLNLLKTGASNSGNQGGGNQNANSVLNFFLNNNQDSEIDIGSAVSLASRFLNQNR